MTESTRLLSEYLGTAGISGGPEGARLARVAADLEFPAELPDYPVRHFRRNNPGILGSVAYGPRQLEFYWDTNLVGEIVYTADPWLAGELALIGAFTEF